MLLFKRMEVPFWHPKCQLTTVLCVCVWGGRQILLWLPRTLHTLGTQTCIQIKHLHTQNKIKCANKDVRKDILMES